MRDSSLYFRFLILIHDGRKPKAGLQKSWNYTASRTFRIRYWPEIQFLSLLMLLYCCVCVSPDLFYLCFVNQLVLMVCLCIFVSFVYFGGVLVFFLLLTDNRGSESRALDFRIVWIFSLSLISFVIFLCVPYMHLWFQRCFVFTSKCYALWEVLHAFDQIMWFWCLWGFYYT